MIRYIRQFIVIDKFHVRNVQTARRHIRSHQNRDVAGFKPGNGPVPLTLRFVAVDRGRIEPGLHQQLHQFFAAMFGATKNQRPLALVLGQKFGQQRHLFRLGDEMHLLRHLVRSLARRRDFNPDRAAQIAVGDLVHQLGHGRREQHRLAFLGHHRRDFAQVMDEPHVKHLIGFIEHKEGCLVQPHCAAVHQVKQSPRRGDQHVHTLGQSADLGVDALAAHNHLRLERRAFAKGLEVLHDLLGQFPCRGQHQCTHGFGAGPFGVFQHLRHQRHAKGRRLAGAGLRQTHHVTPVQGMGDGLFLDRGRVFQTHIIQTRHQFRRQVHHIEIAHIILSGPLQRKGQSSLPHQTRGGDTQTDHRPGPIARYLSDRVWPHA